MDDESKLEILYQQVCKQHDEIQDFRAKLLGLLPIASAGGIFFLIKSDGISQDLYPHLLTIGLFGIAVTAGLFEYELYGIRNCMRLLAAAQEMEQLLSKKYLEQLLSKKCQGAFLSKPQKLEMKQAAFIIYSAAAGAWAYMATLGFACLSEYALTGLTSMTVAIAFVFGFVEWQRLSHKLAADERKANESH